MLKKIIKKFLNYVASENTLNQKENHDTVTPLATDLNQNNKATDIYEATKETNKYDVDYNSSLNVSSDSSDSIEEYVQKYIFSLVPEPFEYINLFKSIPSYNFNKKLDEQFLKKIKRTKEIEYESFVKYPNTNKRPSSFIALDFETTGLDPVNDEIVEIGAIKFELNEPVEIFKTYVKPNKKLSKKLTKLSGITNEMLEDAPSIEEVLPNLIEFIGDEYLVAHNAPFDMGFLLNTLYKYNYKKPKNKAIDTLKLARSKVRAYDVLEEKPKKLKSYSLKNLKELLLLDELDSHEAIADCKVCAYLYMKINETYERFLYLEDV